MDYKLKRVVTQYSLRPSGKIPRHFYQESFPHQHQGPSDTVTLPLFVTAEQMSANQDSSISPPLIYPKLGGFFSLEQWEELELQAFIFKFLMAGAAVPDELVQLIKKSLPHESSQQHSKLTGYWRRVNVDTEPGRCRRADGKKWRCSRDAVEGKGYCERHMSRGIKRSRKHMENHMRNGASDCCNSSLNNGAWWNSFYCCSSEN